jgi:hypothetical protein
MKTITIYTHGAEQAEVIYAKGAYAVTYREGCPGYAITHIPTGRSIATSSAKARARKACMHAADHMPVELDALGPDDDPRTRLTPGQLDTCIVVRSDVARKCTA